MKKPIKKYGRLITGLIIGTAVGGALGMGIQTKKGKELRQQMTKQISKSTIWSKTKRILTALLFGKNKK